MSGNIDIVFCFDDHQLPLIKNISNNLDSFGVAIVEDFNLFNARDVVELFFVEKTSIKRKSKIAWGLLGGKEEFKFRNKVVSITVEVLKIASPTNSQNFPKVIECTRKVVEGLSLTSLDSLELSHRP